MTWRKMWRCRWGIYFVGSDEINRRGGKLKWVDLAAYAKYCHGVVGGDAQTGRVGAAIGAGIRSCCFFDEPSRGWSDYLAELDRLILRLPTSWAVRW